jgi:hypothetical protein
VLFDETERGFFIILYNVHTVVAAKESSERWICKGTELNSGLRDQDLIFTVSLCQQCEVYPTKGMKTSD